MALIGLYVHIPFCRRKCAYCDFNSYPGLQELHEPYVEALLSEVELRAVSTRSGVPGLDIEVGSVYFGGGTPTVLEARSLAAVLRSIHSHWRVSNGAEISIEANPGTVTAESLEELRRGGFNRISLGVQSFDDARLGLLDRVHSAGQAVESVALARRAGFANLSLDLMFGLPGQTEESLRNDVEAALSLQPDHLSLYSLTIEEGTPFGEQHRRGELDLPPDDAVADMYLLLEEMLEHAGYRHYEISNWAGRTAHSGDGAVSGDPKTAGHRQTKSSSKQRQDEDWAVCRHNLLYWRCGEYFGLGAGAHSHRVHRRFSNETSPAAYIQRLLLRQLPVVAEELLSIETEMSDFMMLGLRTAEGVTHRRFEERFGRQLESVFAREVSDLVYLDLLEKDEGGVRLTSRGRLLSNEVFVRFLASARLAD